MNNTIKDLKTGDIILFTPGKSGIFHYIDKVITLASQSSYSHIGMILKNPSFIHPSLKGLYVWQSGWEGREDVNDGKVKVGVQITPLKEVLEDYKDHKVIIRKINCNPLLFSNSKLSKVNEVVYDKPYDILPQDWFLALMKTDYDPQKTNRFWCSALVGYIYAYCGIINCNTDWSILTPGDFSLCAENLNFEKNCFLEKEEIQIN